jgi:hypothetical protein
MWEIKINSNAEVAEMTYEKGNGTEGKCARCNRGVAKGETYMVRHDAVFHGCCVPYVVAVEHLFSDPTTVVHLVREQHRLLTAKQTRDGLARRKARLAAESKPAVDVAELLAMGM